MSLKNAHTFLDIILLIAGVLLILLGISWGNFIAGTGCFLIAWHGIKKRLKEI